MSTVPAPDSPDLSVPDDTASPGISASLEPSRGVSDTNRKENKVLECRFCFLPFNLSDRAPRALSSFVGGCIHAICTACIREQLTYAMCVCVHANVAYRWLKMLLCCNIL